MVHIHPDFKFAWKLIFQNPSRKDSPHSLKRFSKKEHFKDKLSDRSNARFVHAGINKVEFHVELPSRAPKRDYSRGIAPKKHYHLHHVPRRRPRPMTFPGPCNAIAKWIMPVQNPRDFIVVQVAVLDFHALGSRVVVLEHSNYMGASECYFPPLLYYDWVIVHSFVLYII